MQNFISYRSFDIIYLYFAQIEFYGVIEGAKMKKLFIFLLLFSFCLLIFARGDSDPDYFIKTFSEGNYLQAHSIYFRKIIQDEKERKEVLEFLDAKALSTYDNYLNGVIDYGFAYEQLRYIRNYADMTVDTEKMVTDLEINHAVSTFFKVVADKNANGIYDITSGTPKQDWKIWTNYFAESFKRIDYIPKYLSIDIVNRNAKYQDDHVNISIVLRDSDFGILVDYIADIAADFGDDVLLFHQSPDMKSNYLYTYGFLTSNGKHKVFASVYNNTQYESPIDFRYSIINPYDPKFNSMGTDSGTIATIKPSKTHITEHKIDQVYIEFSCSSTYGINFEKLFEVTGTWDEHELPKLKTKYESLYAE